MSMAAPRTWKLLSIPTGAIDGVAQVGIVARREYFQYQQVRLMALTHNLNQTAFRYFQYQQVRLMACFLAVLLHPYQSFNTNRCD